MSFQSIVVGTDGSDTAKKAVERAADLAKNGGGELHIVMAASTVPESRLRSERAADGVRVARDAGAADVDTIVERGDPAHVIVEVAEQRDADLIVVGSKGMASPSRFVVGSVPNRISHHAPCDVIIVHTAR